MTDTPDPTARDRHASAMAVLTEALARSGADREAYLATACSGDDELLAEVRALLAIDDDADESALRPGAGAALIQGVAERSTAERAVHEPTPQFAPADTDLGLKPGDRIGPYKLLEQIGEGGFGTVFVAEQSLPLRRRVAVKVLKAGMDTKEVIARFEAERNALSLLNHPGIARVFDAGATPSGRPYFAMEYIEGIPITAFCDTEQLAIEARLRLFMQVCKAVQHAHQMGIIHRDLKPTNILVMMQDGRAQPKVIDFGIAKATTQPLGEQTIYTMQGQLIGTPEYMSPEQAEMSGVGVDSTTDIYALGVLLYELLTGLLPFDARTLRSQGVAGIHKFLRETEAARPSTRLKTVDAATTAIGARRGVDPRSLRRDLQGDLDWIVMRAMEKQRTRRYPSASELLADVRRHLEHEPVLAGPPGAAYRTRKFVRRHRVGVAFAAMALLLLIGGMVTTTLAMLDADRERDAAEGARQLAENEGARARAVTDFLLDTLGLADPDVTELPDMSMREALDAVSAKVGEVFADYPQDEAEIRLVIGRAYDTLGRPDKALSHLRRARYLHEHVLHSDAPVLIKTLVTLYPVAERMGDKSWVSIGHQFMALSLSVIAREEPELAGDLATAFAQSNDVSVTSARVRQHWNELRARMAEPGRNTGLHPILENIVLSGIAGQLGWRSFSIDAPEMIEELLADMALRDTHRAVRHYTEQALFFRIRAGDFAGAKALANATIERLGAVLGPDHWYLEIYRSALGECLVAEGRYAEALPILERSLAVFAGSVAADAGAEADVRKRLAQLHEATGHADLAAPHRQALVDFALDYAHSIQWSMLRTFLAPPYSEVVASFDAFHERLLTISASGQPVSAHAEELGELLSRIVDTCRRDCADEDPVGMLLATQLVSRVETLAEAGVSGPAMWQALEEASRMANLHPERRPLMQIIIAAMTYQASLTSGDAAGARLRAQAVDALVARHLAQSVAFDAQPVECAMVISSLVTQPRLSGATYDTAARLCVRLLLAAPDRHEYLGVAGAALYRAGRHQEALVQLVESDRLATAAGGVGRLGAAESLAFLAMTHQSLGDAASASEALARLGETVGEAGPGASVTVLALLAEAEDLLAAGG